MKKKHLLYTILAIGLAGIVYGLSIYFEPKRDFDSEKAKFETTIVELVGELKHDFDSTRKKYYEQVVQYEGVVKEIKEKQDSTGTITFVYMKPAEDYEVITEMLSNYKDAVSKLKAGDKITLKAKFNGAIEPDEMFEEDGSVLFFGGSIIE